MGGAERLCCRRVEDGVTQRVLLLAIGGELAERIWRDVCRWSDARMVASSEEWSPEDWPIGVREELDALVANLAEAYLPPVLYRSEHVDCWSMGDVFSNAMAGASDTYRQLYSHRHEVFAGWRDSTVRLKTRRNAPPETVWLRDRLEEANSAWGNLVNRRLIVVVRTVVGGLWTDQEVAESLQTSPQWWRETT